MIVIIVVKNTDKKNKYIYIQFIEIRKSPVRHVNNELSCV